MTPTPDRDQVRKAVSALKKHIAANASKDLLQGEAGEALYMQFTLRTVPARARVNPLRIPIPNPIFSEGKTQVMLIAKDPHKETKQLVQKFGLSEVVQKVVGVAKLKTKFKTFEERRALVGAFDVFLADERVITALPRVLGSKFYESKKQPVAIKVDTKHIRGEIEKTLHSTLLSYGRGTCVSVCFGSTTMDTEHLLDNFFAVVQPVSQAVGQPIQALNIKTKESVALPVWNYVFKVPAQSDSVQQEKKSNGVTAEKTEKAEKPGGAKKNTKADAEQELKSANAEKANLVQSTKIGAKKAEQKKNATAPASSPKPEAKSLSASSPKAERLSKKSADFSKSPSQAQPTTTTPAKVAPSKTVDAEIAETEVARPKKRTAPAVVDAKAVKKARKL
eukprot:ANDGO_05624.mRNA.1 Putative ribosome biogenesis protein C8F11.04